jgi:hypothetical protein
VQGCDRQYQVYPMEETSLSYGRDKSILWKRQVYPMEETSLSYGRDKSILWKRRKEESRVPQTEKTVMRSLRKEHDDHTALGIPAAMSCDTATVNSSTRQRPFINRIHTYKNHNALLYIQRRVAASIRPAAASPPQHRTSPSFTHPPPLSLH